MPRNKHTKHQDIFLWKGYLFAALLCLTSLLNSFFSTQFSYQMARISVRMRTALITTIYRKSLTVSAAAKSKYSTGEIVNFMSTDTDRILNFFPSFHDFWSLPFQLALCLYLLYNLVGLAFLAGLAFAIFLIPLNKYIANKIGTTSQNMMEQKDNRIKLTNEILYGIRLIKYLSWEDVCFCQV